MPGRCNGPAGSGNGGYSAGVFATAAGPGPGTVTLRVPPPLETPLTVRDGRVTRDDGSLVAEVAPAPPQPPAAVPPVDWARAVAAAERYPGLVEHPFPTCYVCGPRHPDGLRIFPGPVGDGRTAAPWTVPDEVSVPLVWAALDCPGGWAVLAPGRPFVLGRMSGYVHALPQPGDRCVVVGTVTGTEGRKAHVATSLYGPDGTLLARAAATWLSVPAPD